MFSSLIQALGVDSSFFIQFVIFLFFYPILSSFLFCPYFRFQNQREKETSERMRQVAKLKEKKEALQEVYNEKARSINEEFNRLYQQRSKQMRESFQKERMNNQRKIQREYEERSKVFFNQVVEAEDQVQKEVHQIAKIAVDLLTS